MSSYDQAVDAAGGGGDELDHYAYNMALAGAYLGPLHILEIAARNAMHHQLTAHAGRDDWWDSRRVHLVPSQERAITDAESKVDRQLARRTEPRSFSRTPDDVVAALDFGFWCGLLGKGDSRLGRDFEYEKTVWQPAVRHAFPNYRGNRGVLAARFNEAREFRNRITHHEPVHAVPVEAKTGELLRLIGFVSMPIAQWTYRRTRLRLLAARGPDAPQSVRTF